MSQVDLVTYPVIVLWTFFIFCMSLLIFNSFLFPLFIEKIKISLKLAVIGFLNSFDLYCKVKIIEHYFVFYKVLDVFKKIFR